MTEASFMRNMDVYAVEENKVINTSPKRTTLALVTIVQKKAKRQKNLGSKCFSFWLGFQALNLFNKPKELPKESVETTRELMKKMIDIDEAKEMQNAKLSFSHVPQIEWPSKREDIIDDYITISPNFPLMWKLMRMDSSYTTKYQSTLNFENKNGNEI